VQSNPAANVAQSNRAVQLAEALEPVFKKYSAALRLEGKKLSLGYLWTAFGLYLCRLLDVIGM
jgi:hypothetical protein